MNHCPTCGKELVQDHIVTVFLSPTRTADHRSVDFIHATHTEDENYYVHVCSDWNCLFGVLEDIRENSRGAKGLLPTDMLAGQWFQPSGCSHYLMDVFGRNGSESVIDVYRYYHCWSGGEIDKAIPEQEKTIKQIEELAENTTTSKPYISIVGGYGNILDGCWHYCSVECALRILRDKNKNLIEEWL